MTMTETVTAITPDADWEAQLPIPCGYTGTRFTVNGKEFRLMNDDSVEAVIPDPRGICRV